MGKIAGKNRTGKSITFDAMHDRLTTVGNVAANQAITAIAKAFPLAQDTKFLRVAASASAVSGSPTLQLVFASVAPAGVGYATAPATAGIQVFSAPVTLTCAHYNCQTIAPANIDVVYPGGEYAMTVRVATGSGDTVTGLELAIEAVNIDSQPTEPLNQAFGPTSF